MWQLKKEEQAGYKNDDDPRIYPGADEVENGLDDDCDGIADDGFDDRDGDGVSVAFGDCDDNNGWVNPGRSEVCDGLDNNCDGFVDEGCEELEDEESVDTGAFGGKRTGCATPGAPLGGLWVLTLAALTRRRRRVA